MLIKIAFILFAGSILLCAVLAAIVKKLALKSDFVSRPVQDRYNRSVVPLGGGIAIFGSIAAILSGGILAVKFLIAPGHLDKWLGDAVKIHTQGFIDKIPELIIVLVCMSCLFALGLWDDKKRLGPLFKLSVQFAVAVIAAAAADIRVEMFIQSKIITTALSVFWIVLIINAFNFLDNMDGASAGIAVIACSLLFVAAALSGQIFIGAITIIFVGALLGFLIFNFPPAKIFMGDAGSLVVGFIVALITLRTTYYQQEYGGPWYPVFMPLIVMAVPLYDFLSVTLLRISQGKSPFVGDTQHFSHRLRRRGLGEAQTVLTLYLATLVTGLGAAFLYQVDLTGAILIFVQTVLILAIIAILESTSAESKN